MTDSENDLHESQARSRGLPQLKGSGEAEDYEEQPGSSWPIRTPTALVPARTSQYSCTLRRVILIFTQPIGIDVPLTALQETDSLPGKLALHKIRDWVCTLNAQQPSLFDLTPLKGASEGCTYSDLYAIDQTHSSGRITNFGTPQGCLGFGTMGIRSGLTV